MLIFHPRLAALLAALVVCDPAVAPKLIRICERESDCEIIGVHRGDRRHSHAAWRGGVRVGWVNPQCQPDGNGWATTGSYGTMAAFTLHHLKIPCAPPWLLNFPPLGAIAAARRMKHPNCNRYAACRRWRDG